MAQANRQLLQFIGRLPDDPLVAMLAQVHVNTSFDYPAAQAGNAANVPASLPLLCDLFADFFSEFTLPAGTDSLAGILVAEWSGNIPSCPRRREPSS
jgi:hypothetical protein